jgi:GTP-binding protein
MQTQFMEFDNWAGEVKKNNRGAIISCAAGETTAYALKDVQEHGPLFVGPNCPTYMGHVIGEHILDKDMNMNPVKAKQLTNVRNKGSEDAINLTAPRTMGLEDAISYIRDDELVEVTPKWIRIRKQVLEEGARARAIRNAKNAKNGK